VQELNAVVEAAHDHFVPGIGAGDITDRDPMEHVVIPEYDATRPSRTVLPDKHCLPGPLCGFRSLNHADSNELVSRLAGIGVPDSTHDHLALSGVDALLPPRIAVAAYEPSLSGVVDHGHFVAGRRRIEIADGRSSHSVLRFH
jgi:hypothetical protein